MKTIKRIHLLIGEVRGQTMAEYGLLLVLVAIVSVAAWTLFGNNISDAINSAAGVV